MQSFLVEMLGWIGACAFAICSIPQIVKALKTKKTDDLDWSFLWLWFIGEIATWSYCIITDLALGVIRWPLHANYFFNFLCLVWLICLKMRFDKKK